MKTTEMKTMTTRSLRKKVVVWVLMVGTFSLSGCADNASEDVGGAPAADIQEIPGSVLKRVTLTKEAAQRIDLKTATVKASAEGIEIPYGALLYDPDGKTWAFVNVKGLSFERQSITVAKIVGDVVSLSKGPVEGAKVVTLGATQLYGAEIGVGDE